MGRILAEVDQLGRRTTFAYDPAGRLSQRVDGAGLGTRWSYDASGRVAAFSADAGAGREPEVRIERDALGRPVAVEEPGMRHELAWDKAGRLVERGRDAMVLRWSYDADGYRSALGYPDGTQTTYAYDAAGDLATLAHPALGTVQLDRDPTGRLVALTAQGLSARWTYEDGGLVGYELDAGDTRRATALERDHAGRVTAAGVDGATTHFSYDQAGQLVGADTPEGTSTFSYDANGRLVEESSPTGDTTSSYDAAGQLIERRSPQGITRFDYDGAGRRVGEAGPEHAKTYTWDALGRLAGVKTSGADGDHATRVVVDALGELAEVDGTTLMWDSADPLSPLCSMGDDPVVSHGSPLAILAGNGPQWLQPDWMGSVGAADPWGAGGSATDDSPTAPGPRIGYRGEVAIDELVWLRNRAYDPSTRAFLSPDPLPPVAGAPWAANPYSYAGNDPIGASDPLGLRPVTEAELAKYREQIGRNAFERAGDWAQDNWEYIAAGAMVVGGIALMATGVGGPAGVALMAGASGLMSAGASVAVQKATTGDVNWGQVAVAGTVGAVAGGAGAGAGLWAGNAGRLATMSAPLRGAVIQGGDNLVSGMVSRGLTGGDIFDPKAMGGDLLIGGGAGSVAGKLGAGRGLVDDVADTRPIHSRYADGTPVFEGQQPPRLGAPTPDPGATGPHSRLRWDTVNDRVYQAREFDGLGNPVRDIDITGPTFPNGTLRPGYTIPEQHRWLVNDPDVGPKSGFRRGPGEPL